MRELSLHILDVLQNAREAGATQIELSIAEELEEDRLVIVVKDNGRGMEAEVLQRALDPFFTTRSSRHVGLGLPLFAAAAARCDGSLSLESTPGKGTTVTASFRHSHLDRAPLGNLAGTVLAFLLGAGDETQLHYRHRVDDEVFELDSAAIRAELGEVPIWHPQVRDWLHDYLQEGEAELARRSNFSRLPVTD